VRRKTCGKCTLRFVSEATGRPELDVTPALCLSLIVTVLGLIIQTGGCDMQKVTPYLGEPVPESLLGLRQAFRGARRPAEAIVGPDDRLYCYKTGCEDDVFAQAFAFKRAS